MLSALRRYPLLVDMAEVLVDSACYVAVVLVVLTVLSQAIKLAF
jgi:hypothetical protein